MGAVARIEVRESVTKKDAISSLLDTWSRLRRMGLTDEQIRQALDPVSSFLRNPAIRV